MSLARVQFFSVSLDGFGTGEGLSLDAPFGHAGERLHEWMFATRWWHEIGRPARRHRAASTTPSCSSSLPGSAPRSWVPASSARPDGTRTRSGRAGGVPNPPFHTPVFVLTHHPRPPIEMEGGTTFHFLDAPPAEALETAREAAGGQDVRIGGGPTMIRELPGCRARRPHAHRGGPDPAGPGRPPLGRAGGPREGLRDRGHLVAQRRHAPDVHPSRSGGLTRGDKRALSGSVNACRMDHGRIGRSIRVVRIRRRIRQVDLAALVGLSQHDDLADRARDGSTG